MSGNDFHHRTLWMSQSIGILLWGLFFITPFFTTSILDYWVASDLMALSAALLAVFWMHTQSQSTSRPQPQVWLLFALFLLPIVAHFIMWDTPNPWGLVKFTIYIASVFLIFRMSQASACEWIHQHIWIALLAITGNLYALWALLHTFHVIPEDQTAFFALWSYFSDFVGPLLQRNLSSLFMLIVVASLWIHSIQHAWDKRWLLASWIPCSMILVSNSRSGLLLLAALIVLLVTLYPRKKLFIFHMLPLLIGSFLLALYWQGYLQAIHADLAPLGSRLAEAGISARLNIWHSSILMFMEYPWFGVGSGNLASYFSDFQGATLTQHPNWVEMDSITPWSHNIVLQFFAEGGIFGGAFIILLLATILRRAFHILKTSKPIEHASFSALVMVMLLLLHGLVSISLLQGFFLAIFGLYLAALFPSQQQNSTRQSKLSNVFFIIPSIYLMFTCYQYIHLQTDIRAVFDDNPDSPRFIDAVAKAVDNPWTQRVGLAYLFVNMDLTHAPKQQWVQLYPYLYTYWHLSEEPWGLKRLILQAHLADNTLSEAYLASIYVRDFPKNAWNTSLKKHIQGGHQHHEPLDMQ